MMSSPCRYINCDENATIEGRCGPHFAGDKEMEEARKKANELTPQQRRACEAEAHLCDQEAVEDLVDLDWWFDTYGEALYPARFMNRDYWRLINWDDELDGPQEKWFRGLANLAPTVHQLLTERLKELDGVLVNGGTHVWRLVGRKHFLREGPQNLFGCVPVEPQ